MSTRRKDDGIRRGFPRPIRTRELLQFWEAGVFREAWDDLNLNSDDLLDLQMEIILNPRAAPIIAGTGGLRKMRFAPQSWRSGKSGALRVCYVYFEGYGEVLLLLVYSKSEKDTLTDGEKKKRPQADCPPGSRLRTETK